MCSQGIYRDEAKGSFHQRDDLGFSAKTLAKKATRSTRTRECREAKGKEEDEMQGLWDPAPDGFGACRPFNSDQAQRSTNGIHRGEHQTLFEASANVTSNLRHWWELTSGHAIREGSRRSGMRPTTCRAEDYRLIWVPHPGFRVVYQGRSATK